MYAVCSDCKQLADLEVCFDCKFTLCAACVKRHYDDWKAKVSARCLETENKLASYNSHIDTFTTKPHRNLEILVRSEKEITEKFDRLVANLMKEKNQLLAAINQMRKESMSYDEFKNSNKMICESLRQFREQTECTEPDTSAFVRRMVDQFENNYEMANQADGRFVELQRRKIQVIEKYEDAPMPDESLKQIGKFTTTETSMTLESNHFNFEPMRETLRTLTNAPFQSATKRLFPCLSVSRPDSSVNNFNCWKSKAEQKRCDSECPVSIEFVPKHLATFRNYIFSVNESENKENLLILAITTSGKIEIQNTFKLGVPNIRGIAASLDYLALTYSNLKSNDLKGMMKGQGPSGVLLFKRDLHMLCTKYDKSLVIEPAPGFVSPCGIAINAQFVFVCDKDLAGVFKIDIATKEVIQKIFFPNGAPARCSINQSYLILTDIVKRDLKLLDINDLEVLVRRKEVDSEPCDVLLTEENLVLFKKGSDSGLVLADASLESEVAFRNIKTSILGFTMLHVGGQQLLVIGAACNSKMKYTFLTYTV